MKQKLLRLFGLPVVLLAVLGAVQMGHGSPACGSQPCGDQEVRHCTVVTVSQGERVFFGGNDDYINRDSVYWVDPGSASRYGAIYFGKPDNVQQGFNEVGLAYDSNGTPKAPVTSHPGTEPVSGGYASYLLHILQECATVEEVIAWVQTHRWHEAMHDQMHFADPTGDAVVIGVGPDGRVVFTRKPAGDGFLVSTNFNLANPSSGNYPCWRYSRAQKMLGEIQGEDELTVEEVAEVMEAVHVESPSGWTLYSLVADLQKRLVYVYFMFQYDAPIVLSIDEEIARDRPLVAVSQLLPEETRQRADQAYSRLMSRPDRCDAAGLGWLGVVGASLAGLVVVARSRGGSLAFWAPVGAVLGPAALPAWLMASQGRRPRALVETMGDLPPYVIGLVGVLLAAVRAPEFGQNSGLVLLVLYAVPLAGGLLLYQAPLLAWGTGSSYGRTVWRRLPAALISTNLALGGLVATGLPLIAQHVGYCGLGTLTILQWWGIIVLGVAVGGLPLYLYHAWAVRRGLMAWSALLGGGSKAGEDVATVPPAAWRRLWPWILASFLVLAGGVALGIVVRSLVAGLG
jgi:hypothetical protein